MHNYVLNEPLVKPEQHLIRVFVTNAIGGRVSEKQNNNRVSCSNIARRGSSKLS